MMADFKGFWRLAMVFSASVTKMLRKAAMNCLPTTLSGKARLAVAIRAEGGRSQQKRNSVGCRDKAWTSFIDRALQDIPGMKK